MVEILIEKLGETRMEVDGDSLVLLVGRGSSDPDSKRDLNLIASRLEQKLAGAEVQTCFLTGANPRLPEALSLAVQSEKTKIFIIPYLLFTGILMRSIERAIEDYAAVGKQFILCEYLGYHDNIEGILQDRAEEALNNPGARFQ
jgi:sirohydrochlorin ferrochelatase